MGIMAEPFDCQKWLGQRSHCIYYIILDGPVTVSENQV